MSTEQVTLFLALLAFAAQAAVVVMLVAALLPAGRAALAETVGPVALWLAALVAIVATIGSLWLSEGAGFNPCRLCWYQRICMYPMAVILPVAARRRDPAVRFYALPLAAIGALIASYHIVLERFPSLESSSVCEISNPCTIIWVERLGYVTIPVMALSGFLLIGTLLCTLPRTQRNESTE